MNLPIRPRSVTGNLWTSGGRDVVVVRLEGVHRVRARGVEYHYLFRGGPRFWKSGDSPLGSPAYHLSYREALDAVKETKPINASTTEAMVDRFLSSPEFTSKRERTREDYRKWAGRFVEEFGELSIRAWEDQRTRRDFMQWRNNWGHSPKQADYAVTVGVRILNWARENGEINAHYCERIAKLYHSNRANIIWIDKDIEAFMKVAPPLARRILTVSLETGLRPGDIVRLSRQHVDATPQGRRIMIRTSKRGATASIPVSKALGLVLDDIPANRLLVLVSEIGRPLTVQRASQYMSDWIDEAGLRKELQWKDTRGTVVTRLLNRDLSLGEIASHMGWSLRYASQVIEHYAVVAPELTDRIRQKLEGARRAGAGDES